MEVPHERLNTPPRGLKVSTTKLHYTKSEGIRIPITAPEGLNISSGETASKSSALKIYTLPEGLSVLTSRLHDTTSKGLRIPIIDKTLD